VRLKMPRQRIGANERDRDIDAPGCIQTNDPALGRRRLIIGSMARRHLLTR
jgi:hypothetical protein